MFRVELYSKKNEIEWDLFIDSSKNGSFLFKRAYMDYHSDRFLDFSLLIYRKDRLYALMPANKVDSTLFSHQGLTFGGIIMSSKVTTSEMLEVFPLVNTFLKSNGIQKVIYKSIPYIYHNIPSQEDLYAIFRTTNAKIIGRNISSTIYQSNKLKFIESRKSGIRKARNNNVIISASNDYYSFWKILNDNLLNKYGKPPVHSLNEIELLASRFPSNIKLFLAIKNDIAMGGTVVYINNNIIHTQYISANNEGKEIGALDLLFDRLINEEFVNFPIFDFGQSTEEMGLILNESLIFQKEGFGGRGTLYDIYEYDI